MNREQPGKRMLFISIHGLWGMGGGRGSPSLTSTLKGYLAAGYKIVFLTGETALPSQDFHPDLRIIRVCSKPMLSKKRSIILYFLASKLRWLVFILSSFIEGIMVSRRFKPNLCYGYEIHAVPAAWMVARIRRIPCISRFMGTVVSPEASLFKLLTVWIEAFLAFKLPVDLVIMANDGTLGDRVLARMGVPSDRVCFWMNGVNKEAFTIPGDHLAVREWLCLDPGCLVLMTLCRLEGWKRIDRAIRAMPDIVARFPESYLVLIGDGSRRRALEDMARDLGVEKNVRFAGSVKRDKIPDLVTGADIFFSLNDLSNVGNPLLEAMTAGRCVVAVDVGATDTVVRHGETGILIKPEAIHELPQVVNELLESPEKREKLGAAAAAYAREAFSTWEDRMKQEVETVQARLAGS